MEAKWLEDYVTLAETRSFSKAAALRHVTQPAFSRRIQALEAWLGADLIDRTQFPTRLTPAGETFLPQALEMLERLQVTRQLLRGQGRATQQTLDLAVPHTLALTFVPKWLASLRAQGLDVATRLLAGNVHDAVLRLVEGGCDLLLVYHHPQQPVQLDPARYDMLTLGHEIVRAYSACDRSGQPLYWLGEGAEPIPYLAYTSNAYLGRMTEILLGSLSHTPRLVRRYETDMAEALKAMALEGQGLAFLPESAVAHELRARRLAVASDACVTLSIRVYRERPDGVRPGKAVTHAVWGVMEQAT